MSKRRTESPEFKARGAMEVICSRRTIQQRDDDYAIYPIQVSLTSPPLLVQFFRELVGS